MTIQMNLYRIRAEISSLEGVCRSKRRIAMYRLPGRGLRLLALAMLVMSILPARAQEVIRSSDLYVTTTDNVSIHVHRKVGAEPSKVPVLLIHGTWGNARTWDFAGRSVMGHLAVRGYDVYALDLRGMGGSDNPGYPNIDIFNRVDDARAVASEIMAITNRRPVVMGWSEGGLIAGLLAASDPNGELIAGVGLLSVAPNGFVVPNYPDIQLDLGTLLATKAASFLPSPHEVNEIVFGTDPRTGMSTISPDALSTFVSVPDFLQTDSVQAVLEEVNECPVLSALGFVKTCPVVVWGNIKVPALVVDGALDPLVGTNLAQQVFNLLGSTNKQLIVFPFNSHGWFLEDNDHETDRVFDHFLSQFSD